MSSKFEVKLSKLINEFELETLNSPECLEDVIVNSADVNRPGLHFADFYDYFDKERIQIIGLSEITYLDQIPKKEVEACIDKFFSHLPVCVIITRDLPVSDIMIAKAKMYEVPLFKTSNNTSEFIAALIATLNVELAPRITRHGVLVEVYGEGLLLFGESGVGKSETAIELIKRG
ncbi:MAG: HPr kinase/phosphorylase, partial [Oscillospiraceae bacterium]